MPSTSPPITDRTLVDYDDAKGRFVITCPIYDNGRVRSLPNRRWSKARGCWHAAAIRANIEAIDRLYSGSCKMTPAAREKLDNYAAERSKPKRARPFPAFYGFKRQPRPKQREILEASYGMPAVAYLMDMRTGKTKVVIDGACAMRMEGLIGGGLLICPLSLRKNWVREFAKDAPIPVDVHLLDSSKPKDFERWLLKRHDFKWLLVGVESLAAGKAIDLAKRFLLTVPNPVCVVDESSKIKTHNATRSERAVELGRMAPYRQILTGTPLAKNPLDFYMQYEFLDPDIFGLGDFYAFRARYAVMGGYDQREVIGYDNMDEFVDLVSPVTFQVRQDEVFKHEKVRILRTVQMSAEQARLYKELRLKSRIGLEGSDLTMVVQNVLEKSLRLQEITGGFVSYLHTDAELEELRARLGPAKKLPRSYRVPVPGKNPKVEDLLECAELYPGSMIVWCAYKDEIYAVAAALRAKYGHEQVVELHGDIDEHQRDVNVNELFQTGKARFCVGNAATGGMGLTMSKADTICYFSNTHNYIDREQSEERGTAEGMTTLIIDIACEKSIDTHIIASNEEKKDMSEYVRGMIAEAKRAGKMQQALDSLLDGD
jgi:hypothetical protein